VSAIEWVGLAFLFVGVLLLFDWLWVDIEGID
jgi:hypothetical protein